MLYLLYEKYCVRTNYFFIKDLDNLDSFTFRNENITLNNYLLFDICMINELFVLLLLLLLLKIPCIQNLSLYNIKPHERNLSEKYVNICFDV